MKRAIVMKFQEKFLCNNWPLLLIYAAALGICAPFLLMEAVSAETPVSGGIIKPEKNAEVDVRPRRPPPKVAVEACGGKKEGDQCSFNFSDGVREGECMAGIENIFACRPHPDNRSANVEKLRPTGKSENGSQIAPSEQSRENLNPIPKAERVQPNTGNEPAQKSGQAPVHDVPAPVRPLENQLTVQNAQVPQNPKPVLPEGIIDQLGHHAGGIGSCFVAAILAAALTWLGFFRYSTMPLRRLRKVTQQLAGGDLSARVGEGLVHRKDEVADLARDVDRMAERIESLVGAHQRLIRDVSHELRSPLARLNVALELARQSAGPNHSAPFDRIERESDRLNELIGQLLMLTKLESESGSIKRSELDISALVAEIAKDADFEAKNNNRQVTAAVSEKIILNGNSELLRQAIENLVRNAVRYTEQGTSVEISIKKKMSSGRNCVHIEVRDHGPGVPESALYDIFRPFYRVNDARERQSGGTGVGLAISDRAVRLHGGSLRAFNATGGGLIMEMELPLM